MTSLFIYYLFLVLGRKQHEKSEKTFPFVKKAKNLRSTNTQLIYKLHAKTNLHSLFMLTSRGIMFCPCHSVCLSVTEFSSKSVDLTSPTAYVDRDCMPVLDTYKFEAVPIKTEGATYNRDNRFLIIILWDFLSPC